MIGASLGSIIRKGGVGLPVVIAIIIFIVFYVMNLTVENITWKGNSILILESGFLIWFYFLLGVWLTYKALTDSHSFRCRKIQSTDQASLEQVCERKRSMKGINRSRF